MSEQEIHMGGYKPKGMTETAKLLREAYSLMKERGLSEDYDKISRSRWRDLENRIYNHLLPMVEAEDDLRL